MKLNTHLSINKSLCGSVISISENAAVVQLQTTADMAADERKLVHGGFIFGAADYAAMAAVNDPRVVLGSAEVKFFKPSRVGDFVMLTANVVESMVSSVMERMKKKLAGDPKFFLRLDEIAGSITKS